MKVDELILDLTDECRESLENMTVNNMDEMKTHLNDTLDKISYWMDQYNKNS